VVSASLVIIRSTPCSPVSISVRASMLTLALANAPVTAASTPGLLIRKIEN
jgi:hypothetical protein